MSAGYSWCLFDVKCCMSISSLPELRNGYLTDCILRHHTFGASADCDCQWRCSVHIVMNSSGKPTGNGYVQFGSAEESKAAMAKDRKTLGSRYIELFPCSQEELAEAA